MRELRNPFRLRASEHIENENTFLRLFGPEVIDILPKEETWNKIYVIRSAEGGGKTSLLRLLTPDALWILHTLKKRDECKDLYQRLYELDAINEDGPNILGINLSCSRNYAALDDMEIDKGRSERLLLGLLNARILIAALRAAMNLKKLDYPADLDKLKINVSSVKIFPVGLKQNPNGKDLYDWATEREIKVCEAIDSFGPLNMDKLSGSDTLDSLQFITSGSITIDNHPIAKHVLLMLDDVQKLTRRQRKYIIDNLIETRSPVGIWIAERFEALSTDEMLSSGAKRGRDYGTELMLENYWREHPKKFEKFVLDVGDRRAISATDVEISTFGSHLQYSLDSSEWHDKHDYALSIIQERIYETVKRHAEERSNSKNQFNDWINERKRIKGSTRERTIAWRALEILIEREKRKKQNNLFDEPIPVNILNEKDDSAVKGSAELFLADEFDFPYYFGQTMLSKLSSANIEQFLWLAGEQFEEITAAALLKKPTDLSPDRQEKLIIKAANELWNDIPKRVKHGREVQGFLESIGRFCKWMTYKPSDPNDGGVNGIAISMHDRDVLMKITQTKFSQDYDSLSNVIASALAHNLLEPRLGYKVKNGTWMVLNLNRLLCVRFKLPLHYGKFKEKSLDELDRWLKKGFRVPKREEPLYYDR